MRRRDPDACFSAAGGLEGDSTRLSHIVPLSLLPFRIPPISVLPALRLRPPVLRSRASFAGASRAHGYLQRTGHPPRSGRRLSGYSLLTLPKPALDLLRGTLLLGGKNGPGPGGPGSMTSCSVTGAYTRAPERPCRAYLPALGLVLRMRSWGSVPAWYPLAGERRADRRRARLEKTNQRRCCPGRRVPRRWSCRGRGDWCRRPGLARTSLRSAAPSSRGVRTPAGAACSGTADGGGSHLHIGTEASTSPVVPRCKKRL